MERTEAHFTEQRRTGAMPMDLLNGFTTLGRDLRERGMAEDVANDFKKMTAFVKCAL